MSFLLFQKGQGPKLDQSDRYYVPVHSAQKHVRNRHAKHVTDKHSKPSDMRM